jgi:hypothetical protein
MAAGIKMFRVRMMLMIFFRFVGFVKRSYLDSVFQTLGILKNNYIYESFIMDIFLPNIFLLKIPYLFLHHNNMKYKKRMD